MPDLEWQQRILFYRELSFALRGKTEAYSQSQRRSATYKKEDLWRLKTEGEEVEPVLCAAFTAGSASDSDEEMAAEAHRQHITRWFYDCSYDVHRGMTDMYVAHDRFRAHYDALAPGLARFVREAAHANADRVGTEH